jgi:predicted ester cyclase
MTSDTDDLQVEANKATVRHMFERLSAGDVSGYTDRLSPDYVRHCQAMPPELQEISGKDTMHQWLLSNFVTFPDFHEEVESVVGKGDLVAWRSRVTGTQKAAFGPFPPSGKTVDLVIMGMHRFDGDLISETWTTWDNLAVLIQLGHFPPAAS